MLSSATHALGIIHSHSESARLRTTERVSGSRRRHATAASSVDFFCVFFAFPSGGRQRARLYTYDSLSNDGGPGAEHSDCADCGPRFPPLRPCAPPRRATGLPTPIATTAAPARVPPGPGRRHVGCGTGPSSYVVTKVTQLCVHELRAGGGVSAGRDREITD